MITIICHSLTPYHIAKFNALYKHVKELVIIQLFKKQKIYLGDVNSLEVFPKIITLFEQEIYFFAKKKQKNELLKVLTEIDPDIIITVGFSDELMRIAAIWGKHNNKYSIMMTDSWKSMTLNFPLSNFLKGYFIKKYYDYLFLSGHRSVEYFTNMGYPIDKIWIGVDVVDNDHFSGQKGEFSINNDQHLKKIKSLGNYFLCVARFHPDKNIKILLEAFHEYRQSGGLWNLLIVGDGPEKQNLNKIAEMIPGAQLENWIEYEALPKYYQNASCFVLPSINETWGLVVNEAMASGLPVLVSRECGCQPNLCIRGINGYDFSPFDSKQLSKLLLKISTSTNLDVFSQNSKQIINLYTPEKWAMTIINNLNIIA